MKKGLVDKIVEKTGVGEKGLRVTLSRIKKRQNLRSIDQAACYYILSHRIDINVSSVIDDVTRQFFQPQIRSSSSTPSRPKIPKVPRVKPQLSLAKGNTGLEVRWDVFISHAWEDKETFARPLAEALTAKGVRVWFDEFTLSVGDRLRSSIDYGLANSRYGIVILSPNFFAKEWPQKELDGLVAREFSGDKVLLPIWHNITAEQIRKCSPILADRIAASSNRGIDFVVAELLRVITITPMIKIGKDGRERVLIPAGEFLMGSDEYDNERPPHKVYLDAFYIDRYPVTNADYRRFMDVTKYAPIPKHWENGQIPTSKEIHPVVHVSWNDALAYAQWAGGRLPTEAEWEKAASWDDAKAEKRRYPWGDEFDGNKCNTSESDLGDTTPIGKYSEGESPYGALDMAGNVWEWAADWYSEEYYKTAPVRNPKGPDFGLGRVLRGGSWGNNCEFARCAFRGGISPDARNSYLGFRIAESAS